jgi:NAD(P)-dependent dehydrogenase (short-subunit alcohol dehydrogenase family)
MIGTVAREKGIIDTIVTSAGMAEQAILESATHEHFDKQFNLNVRSMFFTVRTGLPLPRNKGTIVLVSSGMHLKGFPAHSVYAATKLTESQPKRRNT